VLFSSTHTSKRPLSSILYYISGHGYGHAVRSSQVIRSLKLANPGLNLQVRTTAPAWLFPAGVAYSHQAMDVGIVQRDSLWMNLEETLQSCRALFAEVPELIQRELEFIRAQDVRLIVGDIPALCFETAARAGLASVALGNFSWDQIYRSYLDEHPGFSSVIERFERWYAKATLALTLPHACDMDALPRREHIPWIARFSAFEKNLARKKFSLPGSATIVLLSFGGFGFDRLPWNKLKSLEDYLFITTGKQKKIDGNVFTVPEVQHQYEDLVRAVDVIVTKPGYGIVADAIAHRVPMLYTERGDFPEYPRLVQALADCATAEFIPQAELLSGNLEPYLNRLLHRPPHWPAVELNGAEVAAAKILAFMDG
jgi:UDP:flavonoid glycosyltransferase YjiC (YdhE family)